MINNLSRVCLGVAAALLAACSGHETAHEPYQGIVELDERHLGFEAAGRVKELRVHRGEDVPAGALIATLDDTLVRPVRDARAAEADSARAQADLLHAGSRVQDVRAAAAQLGAAEATVTQLQRNLARQRELAAKGAAGTAPTEDLESELAKAQLEVQALAQKHETLRSGARPQEVTAADARAAAATAALAAEDQKLARCVLAADQAETILDVHAKAGEVVAAGTPVVTVADVRHPFVDVFVPQALVGGMKLGGSATVKVDSVKEPLTGRIEDIGRHMEFTPRFLFSERERPNLVLRVRVRIHDPDAHLHAGIPAIWTLT